MTRKHTISRSNGQRAQRGAQRRQRQMQRRRGSILVYMALGIATFIGVASLSVDMGNLYSRKARAQQAADAAALAGAYQLATFNADINNPGPAHDKARLYAARNGYDPNVAGVTVNTTYPIPGEPNRFQAQVRRIEPTFFARIFGVASSPVAATAVAEYSTFAPLNINGGGVYGQPDGPTSLSMFGPDGFYNNGDYRSVRRLAGGSDNKAYDGQGYDFQIFVPFNYTTTDLEVFDPDCHNAGDEPDAGRDAQGKLLRVDELRVPSGGRGTPANATTTRYSLYWDGGDNNPNNDQLINSVEVGDDASMDLQWVNLFSFNRTNYPTGQFRLNITTIDGSSENGFNLRAGPPRAAGAPFDPNNGTKITATGFLPMNFNGNGNTGITLGDVPREAAGKQLMIKKFDTDIQSQRVVYTYTNPDGTESNRFFDGVLSGNGEFVTDTIDVPADYQGGTWRAIYTAGNQDTSVWEMSYTGGGPGRPGDIRLVR